jgi:hypothetical protein
VHIPVESYDSNRWLAVLKVREGEDGAWATGSFSRARNKLDVHTRGAQEFAVDVSRIPINWERLVVIGIDGVNSELRKRDFSVYRFARDEHGRWVVVEP